MKSLQLLSTFGWLGILAVVSMPANAQNDTFPTIRNTQAEGEHPPSPREMLDLFELPDGFNVTLFAGEPDVQQPIAFDFDDRGRIWVAENYTYSARAKIDQVMRDRIIILHDKDGDGEHDERKVFWDKGRMLTGLTWGYGGLWILNDGTLSFIPDKDGDDVPDSEPVPMLNGWTKGAGHNVVNGLLWGPDGWLYGRHGITDTSLPGTIDTPKEDRKPMNCGIWRFHPVKHTFEIVCHGTTNPWGLDYNEVGDMFMSNNVIGHLWHVIPGAHYERMFGQDFNPHCYELMGPISDHYHWDDKGKWNESRDGKADHLGGGHSHCGLMLYYGQNFPKEYWGKAFMCNTHGRCVNVDRIERKGSSYVAKHEPNFLKVNTPWFRGVQLAYGPAGCVYLSDWSDNGECHDHDGVHRTSGRIYRISYGTTAQQFASAEERKGYEEFVAIRIASRTNDELLRKTVHHRADDEWRTPYNSVWDQRRSRRLLQERLLALRKNLTQLPDDEFWREALPQDNGTTLNYEKLARMVGSDVNEDRALNASWVLASVDAVSPDTARRMLLSRYETVRAFAVKYVSEHTSLRNKVRRSYHGLLRVEQSPVVAMAYASGLQKLPSATLQPLPVSKERVAEMRSGDLDGFEVLRLLTEHSDFAMRLDSDRPLRLMTWYAAIHHDVNGLVSSPCEPLNAFRTRYAMSQALAHDPNNVNLDVFLRVLAPLDQEAPVAKDEILHIRSQLAAILTATQGYSQLVEPKNWKWTRSQLLTLKDDAVTDAVQRLSLLFGDGTGLASLLELVKDRNGDHIARSNAIGTLAQNARAESIPVMLGLLNDKAVYVDICKALAAFDDDPRIPTELLKRWDSLRHGAKEAATDTLCSRRSYAVALARALKDGRVSGDQLTATHVRQLLSFNVQSITKTVEEKWGVINATPEALEAAIAKWKKELTDDVLANADLENGAALFKKSCANCHKLYGEGGKIGPDLTGGNRANMDYLLGNVVNPSGEVPKQFTMSTIVLESGRLVNGVVVAETANTITVQTDKEQKVVAVSDIAERVRTSKSLMPDGLLDSLTPDQVRDLVAFIRQRR